MQFTRIIANLRAIGLVREDAGRGAQIPTLAEEIVGEEFEVEAYLANELRWNGLVQIYRDMDRIAFALHAHLISEVEIRVVDRIEAGAILGRVRIRERGGDGVGGGIYAACVLLGHGLPLPWRRLQTNVAVGRHAYAILDDRNTALMAIRINVLERHDVNARRLKVFLLIETEIGRLRYER